MNKELVIFMLIISSVAVILLSLLLYLEEIDEENAKTTAKEILDFRTTDHSCDELKKLYLIYQPKIYKSFIDHDWYWEVRDKFIDTGCIGEIQLDNLEFIEMCMDSHITGCEISKLKYPDAYKNFNFRDNIKNINSTHWQKLGGRE